MADPYSDPSLPNIQNPTTHEHDGHPSNDNLELPKVQHSISHDIKPELSGIETLAARSHETRDPNINGELENVRNSIIKNETLTRKSLIFVDIRGSTISECTLNHCKVYDCSVRQSTLLNSDLHNSKLENCSVDQCDMTKTYTLAFEKFPAEIRKMILRHCLKSVNNKYPPLLAALVGKRDQVLYDEALQLFGKMNYFCLNEQSFYILMSLPRKATQRIRKLHIDLAWMEGLCRIYRPAQLLFPPKTFINRLECLKISPAWTSAALVFQWVPHCLYYFRTIKQVIVMANEIRENDLGYDCRIGGLNHHLGVKGVLKRVNTDTGGEKWMWRAPKGQTLKWRQCYRGENTTRL